MSKSVKSSPEKLLKKHQQLNQTDGLKVLSHVQRDLNDDGWILHTLMCEGIDAPFKFKRQKKYQSLKGQRVNLSYYRSEESVAGFAIEVMKVVRVKISWANNF